MSGDEGAKQQRVGGQTLTSSSSSSAAPATPGKDTLVEQNARRGGTTAPPPSKRNEGQAAQRKPAAASSDKSRSSTSRGEGEEGWKPGHVRRLREGGDEVGKIPAQLRGELELATGRSLEDVRLHVGPEGAAVAEEHGARAVAIGPDIYFGAGELDASTPEGRELIAHEVAHVVQADAHHEPGVAATKTTGTGSHNDAERDADGFATSFRERGGAAAWSPSVSVSGATPLRKEPGPQKSPQKQPSVTALDYLASNPWIEQQLQDNLKALQLVATGPFARFLAMSTFDALLVQSLVSAKNLKVEDLARLVAPESLAALVDRSRGRDWEQKDDQAPPTQSDKGPASWTYMRPVLLEIANAIARRYDESIKRVFPRVLGQYLEKQNAKGSPEASAHLVREDEVVVSHPMDGHVVHGIVGAQSAVDFRSAAKEHPDLAKLERVQKGIATVRRAAPRWHWLEATPANATAEQVSTAVFGKPEEAHRLIPMPPLWGFHAADAALMTPGVKKQFQTDAFMPSAPGGGMPRKLARSLGLDQGEDEVEDLDPVAELTSGSKGELAIQRAKARLAEKEAREAAGAGPDTKRDKEAKDPKPAMPAHDEADVYAELKDSVDLLDKIHLQLPLFGLSPKAASDAWGRLSFQKEKLTKKQSIPDVDAAYFLAFEQRGLLSRIAKGLAEAGGKLVAAGGAAAPSTVRDPLREVAQPFHDAIVALELPELAEPRVARAEQLLLLSQASILEAKLHEGMPQIENAKQGERIGSADFDAKTAEGDTTKHLTEIAQGRRKMLADPREAQAVFDDRTEKVDDLEFEIGIGEKLVHLDQLWAALRDDDDVWRSQLGNAIDTVLREENREIYVELQARVFIPFKAAEAYKFSERPEDRKQQKALKKVARDAYREIVTSPRFVAHAQKVSKFLAGSAKHKKWAKIIVGLGIAFAAFALGQWSFAAVLADGGGVFAAAAAAGVVTTGATVAMEKLILGHDPTLGSISTGLIFNFGTFFVIGKLAEAARVAGVQAELAAGAKEVEAGAKATKAAATAESAAAGGEATGAAATATAGSKAGKAVKELTKELFVAEVMGVVQGEAASLIDQGRLLNEAEMIELAIQGAVAVVGMKVGHAMHESATASLRAARIESINRDVAWLDTERGEIAAQAKELEATKLDPDSPIDRGKAFALLDRWRVYLERERAAREKMLAYAKKYPKQFTPGDVAEMRKDLAGSTAEVNQVRAMASIAALEPIGPGSYRVEPAGLDGIIQQQRSAGAEIARVETDPYTGQRKITIKPSDGSPPFTITEALPEKSMRTAMKVEGGEAKPFEQWLDAESQRRPRDAQIGQLREIYLRDPRAAMNLAAERNGYRPREMKVPEPLVQVDGKPVPHQRGSGDVLTNGHEVAQQIGGGVFAIADDTFVAQPHQVGELRIKWKEKFGNEPGPAHYDPAKNSVHFEGELNVGGKRTTVRVQADLAPRIDSFGQLDAGTNRVVGQPVDVAAGHDILRQLNRGEAGALKATGISGEPRMPADPATEFGVGEIPGNRAVIIRGMKSAVDWIGLPGIESGGHTHPPVPGNSLRGESVPLVELISPTRDPHVYRELVFPSASDFAVMAKQKRDGHKVYTGFIVNEDMVSQAPATDHTTPRLEFEIRMPKEVGQRDGGERVYHAKAVGTIGGKGAPVIEIDVWATYNHDTELGHLFMTEPPGVKPIADPKTSPSQKTRMASDPKALADKRAAFTEIVDTEVTKGKKLSTPHEVRVLDADAFAERFRSERGRAAFVLENDRAVIYASAEATPAEVKSETYHLRQLEDPRIGPEVRRLMDADLGNWDQMSVADRMEHHRRKLTIEIDAHERMLADGDQAAKATLDNLRELRKQVDGIPPEQIGEMNAGLREVPDALKDPSHLFSKETVAVGKSGARGDAYAKNNRTRVPQKGSSRSAAWSKGEVASVEQLGTEWREVFQVSSDHDGTVVAIEKDSVVIRDAAGQQHIHVLEDGAKTSVKVGDSVRAGETLAIETNRDYRLVEIEYKDGSKDRREEIRKLDDSGWVQRGSESTRRGRIMEDAAERQANAELTERKKKDPNLSSTRIRHNRGGGGFDDVIVEFTGKGDGMVAKIRIREVKDYPGRYVPLEEFTAIRGRGLRENLDVLRERIDSAGLALDEGVQPTHFEGEITHEHVSAMQRALREKVVEVELVLGPDTKLGAEGRADNTVLKRLRQDVAAELGANAFKLEGGEPDRVRPTFVNEAKAAEVGKKR